MVRVGCFERVNQVTAILCVRDQQMAATSLRWFVVCTTLENLPKAGKRAAKKSKLEKLFAEHRKYDPEIASGRATVPSGEHMYGLVRLLLPQMDRDPNGQNVLYNMKEQGIAKLFVQALGIGNTESAKKLAAWKKPEGGEGYGHFAVVLYHQLCAPGRAHHTGQTLTVADVVKFCDDMSAAARDPEPQKQQQQLVTTLVKTASAFELKWIAKVLLRELRASATEDLVLGAYHPDASELFKVDARLREVVTKCCDPKKRLGEASIQVNSPFRPMLAEKMQDFSRIAKNFKNQAFWIEPKFDGERILIHMVDGKMRCFTRNCNDYTETYQPILTKIKPLIKAETCILDGEILAWNRATDRWLPFGNNISVALNEGGKLSGGRGVTNAERGKLSGGRGVTNAERVKGEELRDAHLCLILFDVLLIEKEKLEHLPLKDRRKRLNGLIDKAGENFFDSSIFPPPSRGKKVLEIVSHKEATTEKQVKDELENEIIDKDGEGLMLKNPESVYRANMREKSGWYKLKPEYVSGSTQEYDVIIIGGSHGKNNRSGCMWTWVCGLAVKPQKGKVHPTEFLSFTRIGTGLKHHEFRELDKIMSPHKHKFDLKKYKKGCPIKENGVTFQRSDRGVSVTYPQERINGETLPEVTVWFSGSAQEEVEVAFDPRKSVVLTITADYRLTEVIYLYRENTF